MIQVVFVLCLVAVSVHAGCTEIGRNRVDIVIHNQDNCCDSERTYVASTICRRGWTYYNGSCYAFGDVKKSWDDAAAACISHGSNLIEIETPEENKWLVDVLRNGKIGSVWIGSTEMLHRGTITWSTSGQPITFSDWSPGQPADPVGVFEDCIEVREGFGYKWNDYQCAQGNKYVCETRPLPLTAQ